ncbi:GNAT family N-acetyltransferase [Pseudonocardia asaccharolytica]|uniref:Lysine N-acyltransferase MbtK n=1 Tax=Pseudonocardia asaccharolytica DSM 44247 = NBRC 16224 TaxID=1123024 RepID=A0A511D1Y5_9PSEU|nr:GNAT family N-acetyltransferase [Pseudonocardia asaccharolytica]GEL18802.1 GNAT family N-acetyltransferase [Pseudonocardia asaccharolytica DSM 44247 = NBRC 16224]
MAEYRFRRLTRADFPLLASWLAQPHVFRWWHHQSTPQAVERDFGGGIDGTDPCEDLIVHRDGEPIGLLERSRLADYPEELAELAAIATVPAGAVTLDYLIGDPARTGRGIGTEMIRTAVADTWEAYPDAATIVVAVVAANIVSWRALERAGLRRIAEADLPPDNPIDAPLHYVYRTDRPDGPGARPAG